MNEIAIFKYGPATTPCWNSNLIFLNPLVYFSFVVYAVERNLDFWETLLKNPSLNVSRWNFVNWCHGGRQPGGFSPTFCVFGGKAWHESQMLTFHPSKWELSWYCNFCQWRSPHSNLCNFQCSTNCWNRLNKMNGILLVLNIEFCTLLDVFSKIF